MSESSTSGGPAGSNTGLDGIVGSLFEDERLARAAAMGVPAFVRRAQAVESAETALFSAASRERSRRLHWLIPAGRVLERHRLRGDDLPQAVVDTLDRLRAEPAFSERAPPATPSLPRALKRFAGAVARFNRRWRVYLDTVSLEELHAAQEKYNRYYALEREMALRGLPPRPFVPLSLFQREELWRRFPPLPE